MRLLELSTQATVGFSPRTQTSLSQGYNLLVPPASEAQVSPVASVLDALFYNDGRGSDAALASGQGACALAVFQASNGTAYRVVRQFGGRGGLYQMDPATRGWREICRDAQDITSLARSSCGMPTRGQFEAVFCFSPRFKVPALEPSGGGARFGTGLSSGGGRLGSGPTAPGRFNTASPGSLGGVPPGRFGTGMTQPGGFGGRLGTGGGQGGFGMPPGAAPARFGSGRSLGSGRLNTGAPGTFGVSGGAGGSGTAAARPALPPPLPEAEARAIREKLEAEIAAGKALDEWQFELEGLQQKLFQQREKLEERSKLKDIADARQSELDAMGPAMEERGVEPWLIERIIAYEPAARRRDGSLHGLEEERKRLEGQLAAVETKPVWKRPQLIASFIAGVACMVLGVIFQGSPLGFVSLAAVAAFGYPALCTLGWLDAAELERGLRQRLLRLTEEEKQLQEAFEREYGAVDGAMRTLGVSGSRDILDDRNRRADCIKSLVRAQQALSAFDADPAFQALQKEAEGLQGRISELEKKIGQAAMKVTRDSHVAESELKALEARQHQPRNAVMSSPDPMRRTTSGEMQMPFAPSWNSADPAAAQAQTMMDERIPATLKMALDLWSGIRLDTIGPALQERVTQYWAALTGRQDRRIIFSGRAEASAISGDGQPVPVSAGLERDLLYWSVRLALLEKILPQRPVPVVMEAPCAAWPEGCQQIFARALQHLSSATQVLHISASPVARALTQTIFPL